MRARQCERQQARQIKTLFYEIEYIFQGVSAYVDTTQPTHCLPQWACVCACVCKGVRASQLTAPSLYPPILKNNSKNSPQVNLTHFFVIVFPRKFEKKGKKHYDFNTFFMYLFLHCNVASPSFSSIAILIVCPFSFANSFALHIFYAQMCAQIHPHKYNKNLCLHLRPQLFLSILQPFHILLSPHNFIHL